MDWVGFLSSCDCEAFGAGSSIRSVLSRAGVGPGEQGSNQASLLLFREEGSQWLNA